MGSSWWCLAIAMMLSIDLDPALPSWTQADDAAIQALRHQDRRALSIGWRLSAAAADLCVSPQPGLGWTLHNLEQYRPGLRGAVRSAFGLDEGELGVLAIATDGPAAQAGVRESDVIVAFGPIRFDSRREVAAVADYASLARDMRAIESVTHAMPVTVRVHRGDQMLDLVVKPSPHCPWPVQVETSARLYAASDGVRVSVSSALAGNAERDEDLAFIIAHELAHNLYRPSETGTRRGSRAREVEADRIGLILTARAGYDTSRAGAFMRELGRRTGWWPFGGHPPTPARADALDRLHVRIEADRRAGRPIRP